MSTPVCRYFLNNSCRFGDRCRYSHVTDNFNQGPPLNPYVLVRNQPRDRQGFREPNSNWMQHLTNSDIREIIESIRQEAKQVEYVYSWPLTCLSVLKDAPNVPGWEDYSPEELRVAAYSAKQNGRYDEYVRLYHTLIQKAKDNRAIFLRPGRRAEEIVRDMVEKRSQEKNQNSSTRSFEQNSVFSGFGSSSLGGSIFGASTSTVNTAFGTTPLGSASGDPAPGIFAMAARGFNPNQSQNSEINDSAMETASESLFNSPSQSPPAATAFHQNIFGQVPQRAPQTTSSIFGGAAASSSVFGTTLPASGPFGAPSASSSPFSSNAQGISVDANDSSLYTPSNELSESDLEQFKAATFTLSKLPLVPPPRELC